MSYALRQNIVYGISSKFIALPEKRTKKTHCVEFVLRVYLILMTKRELRRVIVRRVNVQLMFGNELVAICIG